MTRSIAIIPSLIVAIIGGSSGAGRLVIIASVQLFHLLVHRLLSLRFYRRSNERPSPPYLESPNKVRTLSTFGRIELEPFFKQTLLLPQREG